MSPKSCPVCRHPLRRDVEHDLYFTSASYRRLARILSGVSRDALRHHKYNCQPLPHTRKQMVEKLVSKGHAEDSQEAEAMLVEAGL